MLIGLIFGISSYAIFCRFLKNISAIRLLTMLVVIFTMLMTKFYVIPLYSAEIYEIFLKSDEPVFELIAEKFPREFQTYIDKVKECIVSNNNEDYLIIYKLEFLNSIFIKEISLASNVSIYHYYQVQYKIDETLFKVDPRLVLFLEFSNKYTKKPNPSLIITIAGQDLTEQIIAAKEAVIMSALIMPEKPITADEKEAANAMIDTILADLSDNFGEKTVTELDTHISDVALSKESTVLYATILLEFYQKILSSGQNNVGIIYRYLMLQHAKPDSK
jgi:hypothetical protein